MVTAQGREGLLWVISAGFSNVRGWSGYPPKLSVKADIPDGQPSANSGLMQCKKLSPAGDIPRPLEAPVKWVTDLQLEA
jgi:hypothetical protein